QRANRLPHSRQLWQLFQIFPPAILAPGDRQSPCARFHPGLLEQLAHMVGPVFLSQFSRLADIEIDPLEAGLPGQFERHHQAIIANADCTRTQILVHVSASFVVYACKMIYALPCCNLSASRSAARRHTAQMVSVGLMPGHDGNTAPPNTYNPGVSCTCKSASTTESDGSSPIRQPPRS